MLESTHVLGRGADVGVLGNPVRAHACSDILDHLGQTVVEAKFLTDAVQQGAHNFLIIPKSVHCVLRAIREKPCPELYC